MPDMPQQSTDLPQEPYRPFPSFREFAAADVDLSTANDFVAILDEAKAQATPERMSDAVRRATKWAAVDTGAIEGLYEVDRGCTFTVAAEAAAWEHMNLNVGDDAARSINDALVAYDFVLDIVTDSRPITETWIKELHEIICASQATYSVLTELGMQDQPLPKGVYKTQQNNPFNLRKQKLHAYASPADTSAEMHRMIEEFSTTEFLSASPLIQAAYAHYAFVCIHPFADGNGRVARALSSVYLYRSPGVPLVVFADQKDGYIDALEAADDGANLSFIDFVAERAIDVVRMIASDLRRPALMATPQVRQRLETQLIGRQGLPHGEVDALGGLLLDEWGSSLVRAVNASDVGELMKLTVTRSEGAVRPSSPDDYRYTPGNRSIHLIGRFSGTVSVEIEWLYFSLIARASVNRADFVIRTGRRLVEDALIKDMTPAINQSLQYRLDVSAEYEVLSFINELSAKIDSMLRGRGYID